LYCENCKNVHDGSFASGRFCCRSCCNAHSTKAKRKEINEKVSKTLSGRKGKTLSGRKGKPLTDEHKKILREKALLRNINKIPKEVRFERNIRKDAGHKKRLIKERGHRCEYCKNEMWYNFPISLELHHIDGDNMNQEKDNLQLLCPNCHALTDTYRGKNRKENSCGKGIKIKDEELLNAINDGLNNWQILTKFNAANGGNYARLNRLRNMVNPA